MRHHGIHRLGTFQQWGKQHQRDMIFPDGRAKNQGCHAVVTRDDKQGVFIVGTRGIVLKKMSKTFIHIQETCEDVAVIHHIGIFLIRQRPGLLHHPLHLFLILGKVVNHKRLVRGQGKKQVRKRPSHQGVGFFLPDNLLHQLVVVQSPPMVLHQQSVANRICGGLLACKDIIHQIRFQETVIMVKLRVSPIIEGEVITVSFQIL